MDLTTVRRLSSGAAWPFLGPVVALLVGVSVGWLSLRANPLVVLVAILAPLLGLWFLRTLWAGLFGVLALSVLLPFAVLPLGAPVSPALLELAALALVLATVGVVLLDRRTELMVGGEIVWQLLLVGFVVFAFLLGLGRGYTPQTLHDFVKFLLAFLSFWIVLQLIRSVDDIRVLLLILVGLTATTAAIGLALYAAGPGVTERVLIRLAPYGYPSSRIVRYIEDDPARAMRAVGTNVDPNSFGGLLVIGFVLAVSQVLVRHRLVPLPIAVGAASITGMATLLTYSRGAWVGAIVGTMVVVLFRRRWLITPGILGGVAIVALGIGAGFVERLWLGFTLQDPATKLRLAEYRNAWEIIQLHPWFGVGFGDAPSIQLQTGVSSVYLTIAQRAGLVGLAVFLIVVGVITVRAIRSCVATPPGPTSDAAVSVLGVFVALLTVGIVDHYFFNPQFPHMATLFWTIAGLLVVLYRLEQAVDGDTERKRGNAVSSRKRADGTGRDALVSR